MSEVDKDRKNKDLEDSGGCAYKPAYKKDPENGGFERSESACECGCQRVHLTPELAGLVDRWPGLPEHIKQTILILIESAEKPK